MSYERRHSMNEIYKAIEHFERLQKRYTTQHNGKHCELVKTALAALREKAERENGCVLCKSDSQVTHNGEHFCFFCSYCGKRLEVEHDRIMRN